MTGKFLIVGLLLFSIYPGFAETKAAPATISEPPFYYRVGGTCPRTESKQKLMCSDGDDQTERTFTYYEFKEKPSKSIKTTSKACSAKFIEESLKLPVDKAYVQRLDIDPEYIDSVEFKVDSCTLFTKSPGTPQLAMIIQTQNKPHTIKNEYTEIEVKGYSKFTFVKVDPNDKPQKVIKVLHARKDNGQDDNNITVSKICDGTGDDQADIILSQKLYYVQNYFLIRIIPEQDEAYPESWMADGGCGC